MTDQSSQDDGRWIISTDQWVTEVETGHVYPRGKSPAEAVAVVEPGSAEYPVRLRPFSGPIPQIDFKDPMTAGAYLLGNVDGVAYVIDPPPAEPGDWAPGPRRVASTASEEAEDPEGVTNEVEAAWLALCAAMNRLEELGELADGVPVQGRRASVEQLGDALVVTEDGGVDPDPKRTEWVVVGKDYHYGSRVLDVVTGVMGRVTAEQRVKIDTTVRIYLDEMATVPEGTPAYVPCPNPACGHTVHVLPNGGLPRHRIKGLGDMCPMGDQGDKPGGLWLADTEEE
ncbi:hypothetical protein ACWDRR_00850 [Kitasatospora sp. NPDC003701]